MISTHPAQDEIVTMKKKTELYERFITSQDGLALFVRDYPGPSDTNRPPILCLSGLTRNSRDFIPLAHDLATTQRVLCLDYRGRGRSDYDPKWLNYRPETYIADVNAILTALNIHRITVIGTSLGGLVAMGLAVVRPTILAGVVLNDIGPEIGPIGLQRIMNYLSDLSPAPDRLSALNRARALLDRAIITNDMVEHMLEVSFRQQPNGSYKFDFDPNIMRPLYKAKTPAASLWPLFRALRCCPVLALRGAQSMLLTKECFAAMRHDRPDLHTALIPEVGHAPCLEEVEARTAIANFTATFSL